jgi:hypothetical protein
MRKGKLGDSDFRLKTKVAFQKMVVSYKVDLLVSFRVTSKASAKLNRLYRPYN